MRRWILLIGVAFLAAAGCAEEPRPTVPAPASPEVMRGPEAGSLAGGRVVVANRGSGNISVIDAHSDEVVATIPLPAEEGEPTPEPMYVVHTATHNRVFVGDRANDRVAVFNAADFSLDGTVPAGEGVFHMWADPQGRQLWVNNDADNTSTVIDPATLQVLATVATPADLVAEGGHPHDVILGPQGRYAYVTVLGVSGDSDYVVQYDTSSYLETARAPVGKDAHVSLARQSPWLFVPCQNTNEVVVLDRWTLAEETRIPVPGAHGAGMSTNGRYFYTTNLSGGGSMALYLIDTATLEVRGMPVDAPYPVPHNIALTPSGNKLFVTHSGGTADKVTIYVSVGRSPVPRYAGEVTVGLNPFGISYIP